MTESSVKILKPISYSPGKNQKMSPMAKNYTTLRRTTKTTHSTPRETDPFSEFKSKYQLMLNTVNLFLSHNNTTNDFQTRFNSLVSSMNEAINEFLEDYRSDSATARRAANMMSSNQFLSQIFSFLQHYYYFSMFIMQIRKSRENPIKDGINHEFDLIIDALNTVRNSTTHAVGAHDPIALRVKSLLNQLNSCKRTVFDVIKNSKDDTKIANDLRTFSRSINSSFAAEFHRSMLSGSELEQYRSICFTACCGIIHDIKESKLFAQHSAELFDSFDMFRLALNTFLEQNGITKTLEEICDPNKEEIDEKQRVHDLFTGNFNLMELILKGKQYFDPPELAQYFTILEHVARETLDSDEKQINRLKQNLDLTQSERNNFETRILSMTKDCEELNNRLESQNKQIEDIQEHLEICEMYKDAVEKDIPRLLQHLQEDNIEIDDPHERVKLFQNLMSRVFNRKCLKCVQFIDKETKLNNILHEELPDHADIMKSVLKIIGDLHETRNKLEEKEIKIAELDEKVFELNNLITDITAFVQETDNELPNKLSQQREEQHEKLMNSPLIEQKYISPIKKPKTPHFPSPMQKSAPQSPKVGTLPSSSSQPAIAFEKGSPFLTPKQEFTPPAPRVTFVDPEGEESESSKKFNQFKDTIESITRKSVMLTEKRTKDYIDALSNKCRDVLQTDEMQSLESCISLMCAKITEYKKTVSSITGYIQTMAKKLLNILNDPENKNEVQQYPFKPPTTEENEDNQTISRNTIDEYLLQIHAQINILRKQNRNSKPPNYNKVGEKILSIIQNNFADESPNPYKEYNEQIVLNNLSDLEKLIQTQSSKMNKAKSEVQKLKGALSSVIKELQAASFPTNKGDNNIPKDNSLLCDTAIVLLKSYIEAKQMSENAIKIVDVNNMFDHYFDSIAVTSKTDPYTYIPEFLQQYNLLNNSIEALKPFAAIFNNISSTFDSSPDSLNPKSQNFQYLKTQITQMHNCLNSISASKTHNLLFLILSRFITLISSIITGISLANSE